MFSISPESFLVDEMGFPLNSQQLADILNAYKNSSLLSDTSRVAIAKEHCASLFPGMVNQMNWEAYQ